MSSMRAAGAAMLVCLALGGMPVVAQAPSTAPPNDAVSPSGQMTDARMRPSATLLSDGRVLVVGWGAEGLSADLYDPATRVFTPDAAFPAGLLPVAALPLEGRLLLIGEEDAAGMYDPSDGSYAPIADVPVQSVEVAVRLLDGRVLLAGSGAGYVFDPATGAFAETGAPLSAHFGPGEATPETL